MLDWLKERKVIFFWSGTKYLVHYKIINDWANYVDPIMRFAMCNLLRCDPKSIPLMQPYDIKNLKVQNAKFERFTVVHSPGRKLDTNEKGTKTIIKIISKLKNEIDIDFILMADLLNSEVLSIKSKSHLFIDQIYSPMGQVGKSGLESIIFGVPTLSDVEGKCRFEGYYSDCPVINIGSEKELYGTILELYHNKNKYRDISKKTKKWGERISFENTAKYLDREFKW